LLEMLKQKSLAIGTKLKVRQIFNFDKSVEVELTDGTVVTLSEQLSNNLFIKS
jgi:hypothetical protein